MRSNPGHLNAENSSDEEANADKIAKDENWSSSKSITEPYAVRDNAWNFREHDNTDFYTYRKEAPDGYSEQMEYDEPHQTNMPYVKPQKAPELCEQNAQSLMTKAKNSVQMKFAKAELDGCIAELKVDIGAYDAKDYKEFAKAEMNNARLQQAYSSKH